MSKRRPTAVAQLVWHDLVYDRDRVLYEDEFASFHAAVRAGQAALPVLIAETGGRPEDFALVVRGTNGRIRFRWQVPSKRPADTHLFTTSCA